jgi:hypothetical protein
MGDTPLIDAVQSGDFDTVNALLEAGIDVNEQDEQGWTPLNWASGQGNIELVKLILKAGADVLKVGRDQRTPYMIALASSHVETAALLREAESKTNSDRCSSLSDRQYSKAYYLKELRQFSGWTESRINWKDNRESLGADGAQGESESFSDDDIVFLHHDRTVTQSMWHNENIIYNQITREWEAFCTNVLRFQVPDDLDLIVLPHSDNPG